MAAGGVSWGDILPILSNAGVAGAWVLCWLKGWVVSDRELKRADAERNEWKELYFTEREAHEKTREALHVANERGESTTEAIQLVANVMTAVRAQADHNALPEAQNARGSGAKTSSRGNRAVRPSG